MLKERWERQKCEECCFKCVTLQPSCGRRGFVTEYFWIELCWVISFINLHKKLMKKSGFDTEMQKPEKQLFTLISGAIQWSFSVFIVSFLKNSLLWQGVVTQADLWLFSLSPHWPMCLWVSRWANIEVFQIRRSLRSSFTTVTWLCQSWTLMCPSCCQTDNLCKIGRDPAMSPVKLARKSGGNGI